MQLMVVYPEDKQPFSKADVSRIFQLGDGFMEIRFSPMENVHAECDFQFNNEISLVWVDSDRLSIGVRGLNDASLKAALNIQVRCDKPLNIVSDSYGIEVSLSTVSSVEELLEKLSTEERLNE